MSDHTDQARENKSMGQAIDRLVEECEPTCLSCVRALPLLQGVRERGRVGQALPRVWPVITFFLEVEPRTKGNHMEIKRAGKKRWVGPTKAQKAHQHLVGALSLQHRPNAILYGPILLDLDVVLENPKGEASPIKQHHGDRGNYLKMVEDALEGLFYANDSQIVGGDVSKSFGPVAGYRVTIRSAE